MNFTKETSPWLEGLQSTLARLIESPKTTVAASTASATAGVALAAQWINGFIGLLAAGAGIAATVFLARVNWFKGEQHRLEVEHQKLENEMLKKKAHDMGIEIHKE